MYLTAHRQRVCSAQKTPEIEAEWVIIFCTDHFPLSLQTGKAVSHMAEVAQTVKIAATSPSSPYLPTHVVFGVL